MAADRARRRRRDDRGTALVLAPALVLVLVVLAGIAVDLSIVHAAQRRLARVAAAAADDAAGMVDERRVQLDGAILVDPTAARAVVEDRFARSDLPGRLVDLDVAVERDRVVLRASVVVPHLFLRALPGGDRGEVVAVTSAGRLLR